jgi:hypothetical protein
MKLVNMPVSKTGTERFLGSSPSLGTNILCKMSQVSMSARRHISEYKMNNRSIVQWIVQLPSKQ